MKESPKEQKLEHMLRSSILVAGGFMGTETRSVADVIDSDLAVLEQHGVTAEQLAERMQQIGELDESFRALVEFCDLAPDDVDVRVKVADQMAASERTEEAVEQLVIAYSTLTQSGEIERAGDVEQQGAGVCHHPDRVESVHRFVRK